jgi:hypothetical protein
MAFNSAYLQILTTATAIIAATTVPAAAIIATAG